jgi:hypothetical protein
MHDSLCVKTASANQKGTGGSTPAKLPTKVTTTIWVAFEINNLSVCFAIDMNFHRRSLKRF